MPFEQIITPGLPPELQPGAYALRRKQQIADALMAQGMQPRQGFMAGRTFIPVSPLQGFAQATQAGLGGYTQAKADESAGQLSKDYSALLEKRLGEYMAASEPKQTLVGNVEEGQQPTTITTMPSARERILKAMTSGFAPIQQMGQMELAAQLKGPITPDKLADIAKWATPQSLSQFMVSGNPSALQPRPEYASAGEFLYNKIDPMAGGGPQPIATYKPPTTLPGNRDIAYQEQTGTGKVNWGPATTSVTTNVSPEDKTGLETAKALLGPLEKRLTTSSEAATAAGKDINVIQKAAGYLDQGIKAGMFRDAKTAVAQLANELGFSSTDPTVSPTRLFAATMSERTLANASKLGSGTAFSNTDREYLGKVLEGKDIPLPALNDLLEHAMIDAVNVMNQHNELVEKAGGMRGAPAGWSDVYRQDVPPINFYLPNPNLKAGQKAPPGPVGKTVPYTGR